MPAPARATKSTIKTLSPEEEIRRRAYEPRGEGHRWDGALCDQGRPH
jgi:hypothetical protein